MSTADPPATSFSSPPVFEYSSALAKTCRFPAFDLGSGYEAIADGRRVANYLILAG
jgi:hypothetical protein